MSKHTEGPWEARQSVRGYWFIEHQQGGEAYTLTKLDCSEADSRLIASAPELLDALQDIVDAYQKHFDAMPVAWQTYDNIARAAITKATGEQS